MGGIKKELQFTTPELLALMQILYNAGAKPRLIGGCVRDKLLGVEPKDIDIASILPPQEVLNLLKAQKITAIPTGIKYGTITAVINAQSFEITTLRKDLSCDGRWAKVEFSCDFEEDAKRRDFTINALSYCIKTKQLFDYFGGCKHLETKQVVFIGDQEQRIKEDYLRILRFFRFSAYYAERLDEQGLKACLKHAPNLAKLSRERVNAEFDKILLAPKAVTTLQAMGEKILHVLFPAINIAIQKLEQALAIAEEYQVNLDLDFRYALLFLENEKFSSALLKFSNKRAKIIAQSIALASEEEVLFRLKKFWLQQYFPQQFTILALLIGKIQPKVAKQLLHTFTQPPPKFILNGEQIKTLGYNGKNIGEILNYLEKIWIEENFCISQAQLLKFLDKL